MAKKKNKDVSAQTFEDLVEPFRYPLQNEFYSSPQNESYPPPQVQVPPVPVLAYPPHPPVLPRSDRVTSARIMGNGDAAVAEVTYTMPDPNDPWSLGKVFTGSGASKRDRDDKHDPVTGEVLAAARAFEELAARLHREARRRVRVQESERVQAAHRRTRAQWEQMQANSRLAETLFGSRAQLFEGFREFGRNLASVVEVQDAALAAEVLDAEADNPGLVIELSNDRCLTFEDDYVVLTDADGHKTRLARA
jgi:Domain of unknown function (DUF1876)